MRNSPYGYSLFASTGILRSSEPYMKNDLNGTHVTAPAEKNKRMRSKAAAVSISPSSSKNLKGKSSSDIMDLVALVEKQHKLKSQTSPINWANTFQPKKAFKRIYDEAVEAVQQDCCQGHTNAHSHSHKHDSSNELADLNTSVPSVDSSYELKSLASPSLLNRLLAKSKVVSMESKYAIVPWAAEFYCTVTSPLFALPIFLYFLLPSSSLTPFHHLYILFSCLTATVSTLYHMTVCTLWSTADTAIATCMFYINIINLLSPLLEFYGVNLVTVALTTMFVIACVFIKNWDNTATLTVKMMGCGVPFAVTGYIYQGCYGGLICGLIGISCFMLDRKKIFAGHSGWHLFGGLSLAWSGWSVLSSTL